MTASCTLKDKNDCYPYFYILYNVVKSINSKLHNMMRVWGGVYWFTYQTKCFKFYKKNALNTILVLLRERNN
jgi:hypothetical protein